MTQNQIQSKYHRRDSLALIEALSQLTCPQSQLHHQFPMANRTTLRVGGPADCLFIPSQDEDLANVVRHCSRHQVPWMVVGKGSNLLVRDGGIAGVVIQLNHAHFHRIEFHPEKSLICGAGSRLKAVANAARDASLTGMEFLEGIPGSVGGALRMNAGAMGGEIFDLLDSVRFMDSSGEVHDLQKYQLQYHYRSCPSLTSHIALSACLSGRPGQTEDIQARMKQSNEKRWSSQPAAPSAGCTFKNPSSLPAGKLIDQLGLKGTQVGGAMVSDIHGNFMVNNGQATASDFLNLIQFIRQTALEKTGIHLETEVQIVGEEA